MTPETVSSLPPRRPFNLVAPLPTATTKGLFRLILYLLLPHLPQVPGFRQPLPYSIT